MQVLPAWLSACFSQTARTDHTLEQTIWPRGGTERGRETIITTYCPAEEVLQKTWKKWKGWRFSYSVSDPAELEAKALALVLSSVSEQNISTLTAIKNSESRLGYYSSRKFPYSEFLIVQEGKKKLKPKQDAKHQPAKGKVSTTEGGLLFSPSLAAKEFLIQN